MTRSKRLLKICRVVDRQTAAYLVRLEVDLLGFHLIEERAESIHQEILDTAYFIREVFSYTGNCALTKSTSINFLRRILGTGAFSYLQIHCGMDHNQMVCIRQLCDDFGVKLIAVFDPGKDNPSYLEELKRNGDMLLFDQSAGGTGCTLHPDDLDKYRGQQFLLAGGIAITNIPDRISLYDPIGFDIQSSVERAKGKKRFGTVRDIKVLLDPDFPSPTGVHRRCEIYLWGTDAPLDRLPDLMGALSSVIDGVHLEHVEDGAHEQYRRSSLQHASGLASVAPDIPYDLHVCVPVTRLPQTIDEYLTKNENLLRVWVRIDASTHDCLNDASEIVAQLRNRGIRPGIGISTDLTMERFRTTVERYVRRNGVSEICILESLCGEQNTTSVDRETQFLRYLENLSIENGLNLWCAVGRRTSDEHLDPLPTGTTAAVIVGRALIAADDPRTITEGLRAQLSIGKPRVVSRPFNSIIPY